MLNVNKNVVIKSKELKYKSIKSSGPGGQNINKNSTAISLQFDILNSRSLSDQIKEKLLRKPNKYLTKTGKVIIKVNTYKSQNKNKSEAILRLITYFKDSIAHKKKRIGTLPKKSSAEKRLKDKRENSLKKKLRAKPNYE